MKALGRGSKVVLAMVLALASGGCGGPPATDACLAAANQRVTLDQLELGAADESAFHPILDGSTVRLLRGPQGGDMVGVRLRVSADNPPGCLYQQTSISQYRPDYDFTISGTLATALNTYEESSSVRSTRSAYVIFDGLPIVGQDATLKVECGGKSLQRTVRLER